MDISPPPSRPVLKLALYQPWIYLHGGLERTMLELVTRSRHEWTIYTGYYDPAGTFPGFRRLGVRTLNRTNINRSMVTVLWSALQVARQKLPPDPEIDATVVFCDGIGDLIALRNHDRPLFNICCTPLRAAFDPFYERQALNQRGWAQRQMYKIFRDAFRAVDRLAWRHYQGVVAISQEVKSRILAGRLCRDEVMRVAYPGIEWSADPPRVTYEKFVLVAGRIMWTKNIELAIRSFLAANLPAPWKLVIAGFVDKKSAVYVRHLRDVAGNNPRVEFVASPSDAALRDLVGRAAFCLFPPLNEDWGIAPLEAMALAKAVIANNSGGPRESIVDGRSGYLLRPEVADWAPAIARLAADPDFTRRLGEQAHALVGRFTWTRFAAEVDDMLADWVMAERAVGATGE